MTKKLVSRVTLFCLIVAGGAFLATGAFTDAEELAGHYVWVETAKSQGSSYLQQCQAIDPSNFCVELCFDGGNIIPMDQICCIDGALIGGQDGPGECSHWLN